MCFSLDCNVVDACTIWQGVAMNIGRFFQTKKFSMTIWRWNVLCESVLLLLGVLVFFFMVILARSNRVCLHRQLLAYLSVEYWVFQQFYGVRLLSWICHVEWISNCRNHLGTLFSNFYLNFCCSCRMWADFLADFDGLPMISMVFFMFYIFFRLPRFFDYVITVLTYS